jgi:ubiquinone/menaquinone biosynthesis C-methylase UbiE
VAAGQRDEHTAPHQHPVFSTFYHWTIGRGAARRLFDPLRRATAGRAHGVVLEVGAGTGLNFAYYDPQQVERVDAVEPDETMLRFARRALPGARVPISLTRAPAEALPFADASFDSAVATMVFCSVVDPERAMGEIKRVLRPGGSLLLLEHVRASGRATAAIQDALVPLTTTLNGNCHWNRDTLRTVKEVGFQTTSVLQYAGGLHPLLVIAATKP